MTGVRGRKSENGIACYRAVFKVHGQPKGVRKETKKKNNIIAVAGIFGLRYLSLIAKLSTPLMSRRKDRELAMA